MPNADVKDEKKKDKPHKPDIVLVKVVTTSGTYPRTGYEEARSKEHVSKILRETARALHLTDVGDWVAKVGDRPIDPEKTFSENGLENEVCILWNPPESGGGSACMWR